MRDTFLWLFGVGLFLSLMVGLATLVDRQQSPKPLETTAVLLDCDAEFYTGKEVRFRCKAFEPGEQPNELRFRRQTDQPYIVLLRFKSKVPDKLPEFAVGTCHGRVNGVVLVTDCR